ncbi:hypothetical protein JCM6882_002512 [Rhodosporidiobolus microsporus]
MSSRLPQPPVTGANPYADFVDYLQRLVHLRLQSQHTHASIVLIVFLAYAIIISLVYLYWYCRLQRKDHKPIWVARIVRTPQGRYIALNQAVVTMATNTLVSVIWLAIASYLHALWQPGNSLEGRIYMYFVNVSLLAAFLPLFLITYLLISAGNLTSRRQHSGAHYLPPWANNSLLLVVFPALFVLMFVPSIIAGERYSRYIGDAVSVQDQMRKRGAVETANGPLSAAQRTDAVNEINRLTYDVLNPARVAAFNLQHSTRICQLIPFAVLLLINLLGFVFILRHLRQDRTGQLVFHGTSVVAPLAAHAAHTTPASPSTSAGTATTTTGGGGRDEESVRAGAEKSAVGLGRTLSRSLTFTRNGSGEEGDQREDYERGPAARQASDEGAVSRAPWEVTIAYFCVPLICILAVGFLSWLLSLYYNASPAFNSITATEIASLSFPFAYTLVASSVTTSLVIKKTIIALRGDEQPKPPQFQENPFGNRMNRRAGAANGGGAAVGPRDEEEDEEVEEAVARTEEEREKRLRDFQTRRRSSLGVPSFRPSLGGRKMSIVSLASSVGSRFSFSGGSGSVSAAGTGSESRRGSAEKEKEKVAVVPEVEADTRDVRDGRGEPQSLMAGVERVVEGPKSVEEEKVEGR